jgi:hypothetical protein
MNSTRDSKSEKSRKSGTRPDGRRTLTPVVDRLEHRISLSAVSPTFGSGHVIACAKYGGVNHNETLVRARPPRKPKRTSSKDRRRMARAVEGLERRISLSAVCLALGSGHVIACAKFGGVNHNETLVRAPRHRGR